MKKTNATNYNNIYEIINENEQLINENRHLKRKLSAYRMAVKSLETKLNYYRSRNAKKEK